jgi:nitroimidazol reductase NimA-like FMN-containing flavoprotein (pyridoxamine 5'-phosphate oxidase superfamily)
MRRSDKEITDMEAVGQILEKAEVIRLAMVDEGEPYLVAMNFVYVDGFLYMHSAKQGRKIDVLKKNNKVAFQTDIDVALIIAEDACSCTTRYMSVFGTGSVFLVDEKEEKTKVLDALMTKHTGRKDFVYPDKVLDSTLAIKIVIDSMTGKKSGY